jgi:replication factor C subunit 2/4
MIKFDELFDLNKKTKVIQISNNDNKQNGTETANIPWVDKYRPRKLDEVVYQEDVIKMLKKVLETGNMPHLLFHGYPGTGKTSTILAIALELFGPKKYKERVIELNASDERGINIVRHKIVTLAKSSVSLGDPNYKCPPYKIIILDEADAMTTEAQSALRKTMEDNSEITRFCFICNYINQIIDPIASRCVKFRFKPISEKTMTSKLNTIANTENMNITPQAIKLISTISNGDMRKGIMLLQNLNYLDKIDTDDVYNVSSMVPDNIFNNIINICIIDDANSTLKIRNLANEIIMGGFPINLLLSQLIEKIIQTPKLTDKIKSIICLHIANSEKLLIDGADEYLQLLSIFMCIKNSKKLIY